MLDYGRRVRHGDRVPRHVRALARRRPGVRHLTGVAKGMGGAKMKFMALGQGQGPVAQQMLEMGAQRGHWVMLQNCHLLPNWLKTLEKLRSSSRRRSRRGRGRLRRPTERFPFIHSPALRLRVTEPPNGLRLNMLASYSSAAAPARPLPAPGVPLVRVRARRRCRGGAGAAQVRQGGVECALRLQRFGLLASRSGCSTPYLEKANERRRGHPVGHAALPRGRGDVHVHVSDNVDRKVVETYMQKYLGDFLFDTFQPFRFFVDERVDDLIPSRGAPTSMSRRSSGCPASRRRRRRCSASTRTPRSITTPTRASPARPPRPPAAHRGGRRRHHARRVHRERRLRHPGEAAGELFDLNKLRKELEADGYSPVFVVLVQELERWEILNNVMNKSLVQIKRALLGGECNVGRGSTR